MNRRQLLKGGCGLLIMTNLQSAAAAEGAVAYTREVFEEALAGGSPLCWIFMHPGEALVAAKSVPWVRYSTRTPSIQQLL